jgi:KUP system potassium uptake protein
MSGSDKDSSTAKPSKAPESRARLSQAQLASAAGGHAPHGSLGALVLGAIGIVFGDIGTSPLYTLKECTNGEHGIDPSNPANVLGVLSLIFWSITLVVAVKYLTFVMQADNRGEGGILALLALLPQKHRTRKDGELKVLAVLVLAGAALLYGDGIITPAISVLSAVEGLEAGTTNPSMVLLLKKVVVPITCLILFGLFSIQKQGTEGIGKLFGPVMVLWFATLAGLGLMHIAKNTAVLAALNPAHAVHLFTHDPKHAFLLLGAVVLSVTGGEALYADMGHFGAKAIRIGWLTLAMPALVLNYFGQGAKLLSDPTAAKNPFYSLVSAGLPTYLLVALSTAATVIASQALISGAFSLTSQAVQLGFFPRVTVKHTSKDAEGQIYVPEINWLLGVSCIALVIGFKESTRLAAAYGIAVTGTMGITSIVFYVVARERWNWSLTRALPLLLLFLAFDIPFFLANAIKFLDGGYVPVIVAAGFLAVMTIWHRGRRLLGEYIARVSKPTLEYVENIEQHARVRAPGTAVFMCSNPDGMPPVLMHHTSRLGVIHEQVLLVTIRFCHEPFVEAADRVKTEELGKGFVRVLAKYGFMETPNVPEMLVGALSAGRFDPEDATYFLGRETFLASKNGKMGPIQESVFAYLARNARPATAYFAIPHEQVIEVGSQIDL